MNFSDNIKKIRKDNNLSQEEFADLLNVSRQSVSKWESGLAYPEMDKIVMICKKFNVNIDDLLNKDIGEVKSETKSKINITNYINKFFDFITNTVTMFFDMSFGTKIKFLIEETIIVLITLVLCKILGGIGDEIVYTLFHKLLPIDVYDFIYQILFIIYSLFSTLIIVGVTIRIYKVRYYDYYILNKKKVSNKVEEKEIEKENKVDSIEKRSEPKFIIRDPENSSSKFIDILTKIIIFFLKFFAIQIVLLLIVLLIGFFTSWILTFTLISTGLFFIGLNVLILSFGIGIFVLLIALINFIFNRLNNKKVLITIFLSSIIIFSLSLGIMLIGSLNFKNNSELNRITKTSEVEMSDKLVVFDNVEYIESDNSNIIVEANIIEGTSLRTYITHGNDDNYFDVLSIDCDVYSPIDGINLIKNFITNGHISDNLDFNKEIKIYTTKENIEILKNNTINFNENSLD